MGVLVVVVVVLVPGSVTSNAWDRISFLDSFTAAVTTATTIVRAIVLARA